MFYVIIVLILLLIFAFKFYKSSYKLKYSNITFFEGELGSGKTTLITHLALKERKRRVITNFFIPVLNVIINFALFIFPIINIIYLIYFLKTKKLFKLKKKGTDIYSNYPILINKRKNIYSYAINKDVLNWLYRVNEDCIIVLDEVGYLFPQEMKKTDPLYTFCLTWLRHGTNALVFCASQSLSECNIAFRRKVNKCYHITSFSKCIIPFFVKCQLQMSIVSEDISTITMDRIEDRNSNFYRYLYPSGRFASRYGKNYYKLNNQVIDLLSVDYQKTFEMLKLKNGDTWSSLYYEFIDR